MKPYRPTWVDISKKAFGQNVRHLKRQVGRSVQVLAVLKANAYGHGAPQLATLALKNGATYLGVSSLEEGLALRQAGILAPILILGSIYPFPNFSIAIQADLIPTVASFDSVRALQRLAHQHNKVVPFHLKVDTGMGRIGVSIEEAKQILIWVAQKRNIWLDGVYSHLACADTNPAYTKRQLKLFDQLKTWSHEQGFTDTLFHMGNSAATLRYSKAHYDMVRPGLILYGISPFSPTLPSRFSPVLSWKTRVIFLKKVGSGTSISYGRTFVTKKASVIATLPVGYADGVPRLASNKGFVLIRGQKCPLVGRVTMDQIMIDVTGKRVSTGDEVVLVGRQGQKHLTLHDWAHWAQTIPYEIACGISTRVPRFWVS